MLREDSARSTHPAHKIWLGRPRLGTAVQRKRRRRGAQQRHLERRAAAPAAHVPHLDVGGFRVSPGRISRAEDLLGDSSDLVIGQQL